VFRQTIANISERIFMKFSRGLGYQQKNRHDFRGDPDSFADHGSFFRFLSITR